MRVFLYGTLLQPKALARRGGVPGLAARLRPAVLRGWRRVALKGGRYPTLTRDRRAQVQGALVLVPAAARRRLQAYEGPRYRLVRLPVRAGTKILPAAAWLAPAGTRRIWPRP